MKFRKKPVIVDAVQWTGDNRLEVRQFLNGGFIGGILRMDGTSILIDTLEGEMRTDIGSWIIRGIAGEYYSCKPEIFDKTYEAVID